MMHPSPAHPHHHLRYYIVLGTLIIGGIFILLLINEDGDGMTGSIAGLEEEISDTLSDGSEEELGLDSKRVKGPSNVIINEFSLSLGNIPNTQQKEINSKSIVVTFSDLNTRIKIDNDELSLNNLDSVKMTINDFEGDLSVEMLGFSLEGKSKEIMVNGVMLSTEKTMDISFDYLNYETIEINEVSIEDILFIKGEGNLILQDKLNYQIEEEDLLVSGFEGSLSFSQEGGDETTTMSGNVESFSLDGSLAIDVR